MKPFLSNWWDAQLSAVSENLKQRALQLQYFSLELAVTTWAKSLDYKPRRTV